MNDALRLLAEGMISIANVAAPAFPKVAVSPPAHHHAQVLHIMRTNYEALKLKHEAENKSLEAHGRKDDSGQ